MQTSTFEKEAQLLDKLLDYYPMVSIPPRGVELALDCSPIEGAVCELESIKFTEGKTV